MTKIVKLKKMTPRDRVVFLMEEARSMVYHEATPETSLMWANRYLTLQHVLSVISD